VYTAARDKELFVVCPRKTSRRKKARARWTVPRIQFIEAMVDACVYIVYYLQSTTKYLAEP
jgi:hypothetical protein